MTDAGSATDLIYANGIIISSTKKSVATALSFGK
jgi:hypothetical protein